jgi:hypothetical protein
MCSCRGPRAREGEFGITAARGLSSRDVELCLSVPVAREVGSDEMKRGGHVTADLLRKRPGSCFCLGEGQLAARVVAVEPQNRTLHCAQRLRRI